MSARARTVEARAALAAELVGCFTVGALGAECGIAGALALCSDVAALLASASVPSAKIPPRALGLVEAGAASFVSRGLSEYARRACARIYTDPARWVELGGVILGSDELGAGMSRGRAAAFKRARKSTARIAESLTGLAPERLALAARSVAAAAPPRAGDVGSTLLTAAGLAAIWSLSG